MHAFLLKCDQEGSQQTNSGGSTCNNDEVLKSMTSLLLPCSAQIVGGTAEAESQRFLETRVCSRDFPGREFPGIPGFFREFSREQKINGISREFPGKFPGFSSFSRFPFPGK